LSLEQNKIAFKVERLLVGLTINEAKELLYAVRKSIEKTKIS
jgi:ribosomal protein L7/L12